MSKLQRPDRTGQGSSSSRLLSLPEVLLCEGVLACLDVVSLGCFTLTCHTTYHTLNTGGLWGVHLSSLFPSWAVPCIPSPPSPSPSLSSLLNLVPPPHHRTLLANRLTRRSKDVRGCVAPLLSAGTTVLHVEMYTHTPTHTQELVGASVYSCVIPLAHLPSLTSCLYTPHTYTPQTLTGCVLGLGLGEVLGDELETDEEAFALTLDVAAIDTRTRRCCRVQEWGSLTRVHCWSAQEEGEGEGAVWRMLLDDRGSGGVVSCPGPFSHSTINTRLDLSFCPSLDIRQDEEVRVLCAPLELRLIDAHSEQYHDEHPQLAHSRADFAMATLLKPLLHYLAGLAWTAP